MATASQLIEGAESRAECVPRLLQIPQVEGEIFVVDAQASSVLTKWTRYHAKLFDSCFLLFKNKTTDVPSSVFLVEDAVIQYDAADLPRGIVVNSSLSTQHKFSITRPTGRKLWISARDNTVRDAWIRALLSTGSASIAQ